MSEEFNTFEPIENVQYVYCEHLQTGTQRNEMYRMWSGDGLRFILCPICHKLHIGHTLKLLSQIPPSLIRDYMDMEQE